MNPLSMLYGSVVKARNSLYDHRIFKPRRLAWPVVSVGNISVGGSGKTPFVIMLGALLAERGIPVDVLTRGYGRSTSGVLAADARSSPAAVGDEPVLIARKLHCPVYVGASRYQAGFVAERQHPGLARVPIHLLDDGFQHRQLHRDFNVVLLNDEDARDGLLPIGRLREPMGSITRADAVVVSETFPADRLPVGTFQKWRIRRISNVPKLQAPVIAFCGIARPQRFFSELRQNGMDVREELRFRDHHWYDQADIARLLALKSRIPGAEFITTEKDAINLGPHLERLAPFVIPMWIELQDAQSCLDHMLAVIAQQRGSQ
jgi:tetraacyldisaccharide 4'-kinase